MSARAGAVLALLLACVSSAAAAPVTIPRNELAGRERERFIDPFPPPRAGQGPFIIMPTEPAPRGKRPKSKKKKR
jgi:hypothetical protein